MSKCLLGAYWKVFPSCLKKEEKKGRANQIDNVFFYWMFSCLYTMWSCSSDLVTMSVLS